MKKVFLIFTFLIAFGFTTVAAFAQNNHLHTITLEKSSSGYNIILGTDRATKVIKKTPADNELEMDLIGITSQDTVNAIYKGTTNVDGLVIENSTPGKLKIYITADNIKNSTLILEPINGEPAIVGESMPLDKVLWTVFVLALFAVIFKISKDISEEDDNILIKRDIKDREIELYKKYRDEVLAHQELNAQELKMQRVMRKIDRKIDERLTSNLR